VSFIDEDGKTKTVDGRTNVLLEPNSLFLMEKDCRYEWRHGITRHSRVEVPKENGKFDTIKRKLGYRRVSLTIRKLLEGRKQTKK